MRPLLTLALVMVLLVSSATAFADRGDEPQAPAHPTEIIEAP
jgi:hypothetical protein